MTGCVPSSVLRHRSVNSGNGTCIGAKDWQPARPMMTWCTQLLCPSAVMMLSVFISPSITRGKAGQMSDLSFTGLLDKQYSHRFRQHGGIKTRFLHLRHTWISDCHASVSLLLLYGRLSMKESNISSRTLSGRASILITWPTSHQVSQYVTTSTAVH